MRVFSNTAAKKLDAETQSRFGVRGFTLMRAAGEAVARRLLSEYPSVGRWCVVCGKGNNGGDGLVAAADLLRLSPDIRVDVLLTAPSPSDLEGESAEAWRYLQAAGHDDTAKRLELYSATDIDVCLQRDDGFVDALFGIGLSRPIEGDALAIVHALNARSATVPAVAVDVPSGLGDVAFDAGASAIVRADLTITIGVPKQCLFAAHARGCVGRLIVEPICFPPALLDDATINEQYFDLSAARAWLPARPADANKGTFGRLLLVCGSATYAGAAIFCATAAHRMGTGLVYLASTRELNPIYKVAVPESCTVIVPSSDPDAMDGTSAAALIEMMAKTDAVVIGPGLGNGAGQQELVRALIETTADKPLLIDADGLNCLAALDLRLAAGRSCVMTPHSGEAARLLGSDVVAVQSDRCAAARTLAALYNAVVVLKGAGTVIAEPGGQVCLDHFASPVLSRGGTGDVLAGIIGGLLAQGVPPWKAAILGTRLLAAAGLYAAQDCAERGVLTREIVAALPFVL